MGILSDDNAVKESFRRVKEHMLALEREIRANREFIIAQNNRIEALERQILSSLKEIKEEGKASKEEISSNHEKEQKEQIFPESEGNILPEESINHYQIESPQERKGYLATPRRRVDTLATGFRHPGTDSGTPLANLDIEEIKAELNKVFNSLTNREFKVFMAIYSLEEQHSSAVTYSELAQSLDLSSSSIRDYISELARKGAPIKKEKTRNGVAYVSVLPEFRSLNLISRLIAFRNMSSEQKSLFDASY